MGNSGVYKITCTQNNTFYIGRTCNFTNRMNCHKSDLSRGTHKNAALQNVFNKYGMESMEFELLYQIDDKEGQIAKEQELLNLYIGTPECLNINKSAETFCDVPWTEERKRKISEAHRGKKMPPMREEVRLARRERMIGKKLSDGTRLKIREKALGRHKSREELDRLSERYKGEGNPMYGRVGWKNPQSAPVFQVELLTGKVLREFPSPYDAAVAVGGNVDTIRRACSAKKTSCYGYLWFRKDGFNQEEAESLSRRISQKEYIAKGADRIGARAVIRVDKHGDEKTYACIADAKIDGFDPSSIVKVCKGKLTSHKGYRWIYK